MTTPSKPIILAGSPGGHIDLLRSVAPALGDWPLVWATAGGPAAASIAAAGDRVVALPRFDRRRSAVVGTALRSLTLLLRERPRALVVSGASLVLPLAVLARLLQIPVVFAETMARVTGPSASGRLLSRLAAGVLVQWPEMARVYPGAIVCRPALLEQAGSSTGPAPSERVGTFVAVGTHDGGFDRLLETVSRAVAGGVLPEPLVVQSGHSRSVPATGQAWFTPDEMREHVAAARYVVCHAGAGIVSSALRAGVRPLVMARRAALGEHVDDHQGQIVAKLGELGLIVSIEDEISPVHLRAADAPLERTPAAALPSVGDVLAAELRRVVSGESFA